MLFTIYSILERQRVERVKEIPRMTTNSQKLAEVLKYTKPYCAITKAWKPKKRLKKLKRRDLL